MKIILAVLFMPFIAFASIQGLPFGPRHHEVMERAIEANCGIAFKIVYLSHTQIDEQIDQGLVDMRYRTKLEMTVRIDQGVFDIYRVVVHSSYFSQYDHDQKEWGHHRVDSVTCELQ